MVLGLKKKDSKMDTSVPSVDKAPSKYVKYECKLTQRYKDIAEKALHETDAIRSQSLDQFREWIVKDPYIKRVRTDPDFLLRFLRTCKFNVPNAVNMLKRYLASRDRFSVWFRNLNVMDPKMLALFEDGFMTQLPKKDSMGRQVMIYNIRNLDPTKYTSDDVFRLQECVYQTLFEDEETQIAGYTFIFDYSAVTLQHVAMFSITDFKNFLNCVRKTIPIRIASMLVLQLPTYLAAFYEVTMSILSPKLRQRFKVYKSLEDFQKAVDIAIFPKEWYEGDEDSERILADFKKRMISKREKIEGMDLMEIEKDYVPDDDWLTADGNGNFDNGVIGSFRKLEVD